MFDFKLYHRKVFLFHLINQNLNKYLMSYPWFLYCLNIDHYMKSLYIISLSCHFLFYIISLIIVPKYLQYSNQTIKKDLYRLKTLNNYQTDLSKIPNFYYFLLFIFYLQYNQNIIFTYHDTYCKYII